MMNNNMNKKEKVYKALNRDYRDMRSEKQYKPGTIILGNKTYYCTDTIKEVVCFGESLFKEDFYNNCEKYVEIEVDKNNLNQDREHKTHFRAAKGHVTRELCKSEITEYRNHYL